MLLAVGLIGYALHNLGNRYFWTDESSTFFAALAWPSPGGSPGAMSDAWQWTMTGFLDPGFFHMLVRYWAMWIGTDIVTLRLLPFLLFLGYVIALLALFRLLGAPWFLAAGGIGLMMLDNITPYYAIELRPYSGGLAATVVLPLLALWLIRKPSTQRLLLLTAAVLTLGSMQYNALPVMLAVAALLALSATYAAPGKDRVVLLLGAFISMVWLPFLYLASRGSPIRTSGGRALDYIPDLVLTAMPPERALSVIGTNLFSFTALPRTIFLVIVPILWLTRRLPPLSKNCERSSHTLNLVWLFVLTATGATIVLAVLGFIPWIVGTRWSIGEIGLIGVSLAGLAGLLMIRVRRANQFLLSGVAILSVLLAAGGAARLLLYERPNDVDFMSFLAPAILSGKQGGTVLDTWSYPDARYWMEYSGQQEALRSAWISHGIRPTATFDEAGPQDVEAFLRSQNDRMLLRGISVIQENNIILPPGVSIATVPDSAIQGPLSTELPIVLVKGP